MKKQQCPVCRGKGELQLPKIKLNYYKIEIDPQKVAIELNKLGYSMREIAQIMGFNSPGSVKHLLDKST